MESARRRQCSGALLFILIFCVAAYLAGGMGSQSFLIQAAVLAGVMLSSIALWVFFWSEMFLPLLVGGACPACRKRGMKRIARASGYFQCVHCGARRKRLSPASPWEDASGPEADAIFGRAAPSGRWTGYTPPEPGANTSGVLLRNKWSRHATADEEPPAQGDSTHSASEPGRGV